MNRIFMSETEMNIGEYIIYKKLAQAVMDLRYTDIPIIQIAQKNGFNSQENFTRALKKAFHVTPNQFRKEHVWSLETIDSQLLEVVEETSHENARQGSAKLPKPRVRFVHKEKTLWYSIQQNNEGMFPHDFYVQCTKDHIYERLYSMSNQNPVGGAYLTHIFKSQKFSSLTLGFETEYQESCQEYLGLCKTIVPESDYLIVNVPPYSNFELGAHVLAAWNVFSEFDYAANQLKRNLDEAPIFEWDSAIDGYTLCFPVIKCMEEKK